LAELVTLAKQRPGSINVGVYNRGGIPHLTGEWLRKASGADLTMIHYQGPAQLASDVLTQE
jgi:tripartite-type tricarboxylate transporter receptor subunit TctC